MTTSDEHVLESCARDAVEASISKSRRRLKKRHIAKTVFLFPEMGTGPENPWFTRRGGVQERLQKSSSISALEVCAGGGGQALGFEQAGVEHAALIELDKHACATLRSNRPQWRVLQENLKAFDGSKFKGIDI